MDAPWTLPTSSGARASDQTSNGFVFRTRSGQMASPSSIAAWRRRSRDSTSSAWSTYMQRSPMCCPELVVTPHTSPATSPEIASWRARPGRKTRPPGVNRPRSTPDLPYRRMTYSIVARDKTTGEFGVAVQSHYFQVGPVVPWALAGVGAVATQSRVNVSFGPLGLDYMRAGYSPEQALRALLAGDSQPEVRQVALVDGTGNVAAHTGAKCIPAAGHRTGDGFSCQANLMEKDTVWDAMSEAYSSANAPLAERMLAALDAAEAEGGDIRGKQSAAMLVVTGTPTGREWEDRIIDLRVEDAPDPLAELRRLLHIKRAYETDTQADKLEEAGDKDAALEKRREAMALAPEMVELRFWTGLSMAEMGRLDEGCRLIAEAADKNQRWIETIRRLVAAERISQELAGAIETRLAAATRRQ